MAASTFLGSLGFRALGLRGLSAVLLAWDLVWLPGDGFCEESPEGITLELGRVEDYMGSLGLVQGFGFGAGASPHSSSSLKCLPRF